MGTLADEVKLVRFKSEVVRVPHDIPYVEYQDYKEQPRVVDLHSEMPMMEVETYRAKVYTFINGYAQNRRKLKVALDEESQNIVDMFVQSKTTELYEIIESYKDALELEKTKMCHDELIDWLDTKLKKWSI